MPTIDPTLVPTINPGSLFDRLSSDTQLNIRYYVSTDPVSASVLNRPLGDIAVRQLILAKTLDALNLRLSHQSLFPFLVQPKIISGTTQVEIPPSWIWDMNVSLPKKWERVRLAKVKRLSGLNPGTDENEYTGRIRLVFTAQEKGSTTEVSVFQADYHIDSELTYQDVRITIPTEESVNLPAGESETIDGFVTFRTLDTSQEEVQDFLNLIVPPMDTSATDSNGFYINPVSVDIKDSTAGGAGVTGDFDFSAVSHGTGLLTLNAFNPIPALDSDVSIWINTFNYPFDVEATLTSSGSTGITIPTGLFREFNLIAPGNDRPTGDSTGENFPVYINRIVRKDASSDNLQFVFATFNIETDSLVPVEFATLDLSRDMDPDEIVPIVPSENLFPSNAGNDLWMQGFGKGHVVLSNLWGGTSTTVDNFFDSFQSIIDEPPQAVFTEESTRLSSFGLSRVPQYTPTVGQSEALKGSKDGSDEPSASNRYVVEEDQGLGTQVDFATNTELDEDKRENPDIERFGYTGSLTHRMIKMIINTDGEDHEYDEDVLPRLRILLGRDPIFGDMWYDGTSFKIFNGDSWIG